MTTNVNGRCKLLVLNRPHRLTIRRVWDSIIGFLSLSGFLAITACGSHAPHSDHRDVTFTHLTPFLLDVGSLEIVEDYKSPFTDPHVEHLVPLSPISAARRWAVHSLRPVGETGKVRITITDASIIGEILDVNQDFKSFFTNEQAARYHARIAITIDVLDDRHISRAYVSGDATASHTVPEDASLAERDQIMINLTETLLETCNAAITPKIEQFFRPFLR